MSGDYYGQPTGALENRHLRLEYLTEVGPRLVRLKLAGSSQNVLAELPDIKLPTPIGDFSLRGGHRLWHSPEDNPRTYVPDDGPIEVETSADGVRLVQPADKLTGIAKSVEVRLHSDRPALTVRHQLRNDGVWPVEFAPWGITMLPLGGLAILPQQTKPLDVPALRPNRNLVLWPYTSWSDPRLALADDYILIHANPRQPPCKVGYLNRHGWVAYLRQDVLFVKRFVPRPAEPHPDFGCNAEFYCDDRFIEMESLGPLVQVGIGESVEHVETWELHAGVDAPQSIAGVRDVVRQFGLAQ